MDRISSYVELSLILERALPCVDNVECCHGSTTDNQVKEGIDKRPVLVAHVFPVKTKLIFPSNSRLIGSLGDSGLSPVTLLSWT